VSFARASTGFTYIYYTEQLPFLVFPIKKTVTVYSKVERQAMDSQFYGIV
jgi:hypothetical protein